MYLPRIPNKAPPQAPPMMPFQLNNQRGITLIEMMVAITVGLILLAGIIELFVTNKQAYRIQEGTNVLNENARYLLNQFDYDLRMVGHWGGVLRGGGASGTTFSGVKVVGTAPAPDCTQSPALSLQGAPTRGAFGLQGFDGGNLSPLSCIPAADYKPFTDVLVVRYGGAERVTNAAVLALPSTKFLRTGSDQIAEIFNGSTLNTLYNSGAANGLQIEAAGFLKERNATYLYNVYYYFVRKCASQDKGTAGVCDAADDTTPTLTRLSLRGGALVQEDVIAERLERHAIQPTPQRVEIAAILLAEMQHLSADQVLTRAAGSAGGRGVRRQLHERSHGRPARCSGLHEGQARRAEHTYAGGAGLAAREARCGARGAGRHFPRGGSRMA